MPRFVDDMLLRLADDDYVESLLSRVLSLRTLFAITYEEEERALDDVTFSALEHREIMMPVFETVRASGARVNVGNRPERVEVTEERPRQGRLGWVDAHLSVRVAATTRDIAVPLEAIQSRDFSDLLGTLDSFEALRTALADRYPPSVVEAFIEQIDVRSLAGFERVQHLFVEFVGGERPAEDDAPAAATQQVLPLTVCVLVHPDGTVDEALRRAKTIRQLLRHEVTLSPVEGFTIVDPHVVVIILPEAAVDDDHFSDHTASEAREALRQLFTAERMALHFEPA